MTVQSKTLTVFSTLLVATFFAVGNGLAFAQDGDQAETADRLIACDDIDDVSERLACFDAVVNEMKESSAAVDDRSEQGAVPEETVEVPAPEPAPAAVPAVVEAVPVEAESPPPETTESADEPGISIDVREAPPTGKIPLGLQGADEEGTVHATIVKIQRMFDGRFTLTLDNGQSWRETQGSRVGMPKVGQSVEIFEGRMGGYRMRIENIPQLAWVRRTK